MKSAWFVRKMSFAPIAEPALTVSAARETIVRNAAFVSSVWSTFVTAAMAAPIARKSVRSAVRSLPTVIRKRSVVTAESAVTVRTASAKSAQNAMTV